MIHLENSRNIVLLIIGQPLESIEQAVAIHRQNSLGKAGQIQNTFAVHEVHNRRAGIKHLPRVPHWQEGQIFLGRPGLVEVIFQFVQLVTGGLVHRGVLLNGIDQHLWAVKSVSQLVSLEIKLIIFRHRSDPSAVTRFAFLRRNNLR